MSANWNTAVSLFINVPLGSCPLGCHFLGWDRGASLGKWKLPMTECWLKRVCDQPDGVFSLLNQQDLRVKVRSWVAVPAGIQIRTHIALDTPFSAAI